MCIQTVTVAEFKTKVQEETGLLVEDQRLLFAAVEMREGKLSDYPGIGDNATVHVVQRMRGGGDRKVDPSVPRCRGPCMVTYVDYDQPECVTMPCGHVIHPDELVEFCNNEVYDNHKWEIVCFQPGCKGVWSIGFLKKCGMTQEELNLLSKGMSANYCKFNLDAGIQKCPGCQCWCERTDKTKDGVRCAQCSSRNGKPYDFCWLCSLPWTSGHKCKVGGALDILAKCEETTIYGVKCPGIRACPKCGALIQHKEACKHMKCRACQQEFCFVCLRLKLSDWQCGKYNTPCNPAPRQTMIAGAGM